jgi:hypothetical protein
LLEEHRLGELHERDIEEVDPEARPVGLVDMAVPAPEGVSTTSPGIMSTRAPFTTVNVPGLASSTSRNAAGV